MGGFRGQPGTGFPESPDGGNSRTTIRSSIRSTISTDRVQVPGAQYLETGRTYEKDESGRPEHWRAIYDDKGRIIVAICHNMDFGDAWEWSDDPGYPEKWAGLAYRIAMNYFIYDLTH